MASSCSTTESSDLLAERASRGDSGALAELYDHWSDRVYRFVLVRTGGMHDPAEDICQDVWLRVARSIRTFAIKKATGFAGWLFTIAGRCVTDSYRRSARRPEIPTADLLTAPQTLAGPGADETGLSAELHEALTNLHPRRARVLTLRYFVGLTVEETADALDCTPAAVRSAQCRAIRDMKKHLGAIPLSDGSSPTLMPLAGRVTAGADTSTKTTQGGIPC